jgi:regulator of replication initiation timing
MEELIVLLGLAADTTAEELAKMHKSLVDECLQKDKKIAELEAAAKIAEAQIEELTQGNEELTVEVQQLRHAMGKTDKQRQSDDDKEAAPFKNGNPLPAKELKKLGEQSLKANPLSEKVFVTQDGECFVNATAAINHRRTIGGKLSTYYRAE